MNRKPIQLQLATTMVRVPVSELSDAILPYSLEKCYNKEDFCHFKGALFTSRVDNNVGKLPSAAHLEAWAPQALFTSITVHIAAREDKTLGDGSALSPFTHVQRGVEMIPKNLGGYDAEILLEDGDYSDGVTITGFYGLGTLTLRAKNRSKCKLPFVRIVGCHCQVVLDSLTLTKPSEENSALYVSEVASVVFENGYIFSDPSKTTLGLLLRSGTVSVENSVFQNCASCFSLPQGRGIQQLHTRGNSGKDNSRGFDVSSGLVFHGESNGAFGTVTELSLSGSAVIIHGKGGEVGL